MDQADLQQGGRALRQARAALWPLMAVVALFSCAVNLLMLTGPLFMLQVYDRVLTSRSVQTLAALFVLVGFLYLLMAVIDLARNRLLQRAALRFQRQLAQPVFEAGLATRRDGLRGLDAMRRAMASPALPALFDLPWTPLFFGLIFLFHPMLGLVAAGGGTALIAAALLGQIVTHDSLARTSHHNRAAHRCAGLFRRDTHLVNALGIAPAAYASWQTHRDRADDASLRAADRGLGVSVLTRSFRLFLQSLMLAAGALLVLRQELGAGAMIVASILMGRALAPIEQLVAQWPVLLAAQQGWRQTGHLLASAPPATACGELPPPAPRIEVLGLTIAAAGEAAPRLDRIGLRVMPGQILGITGPSGAGKSTLALALTGALPLAGGQIRLGDVPMTQYRPDTLARHIGFLPQGAPLFDGSVAQNIARLAPDPDPHQVMQAARIAGAHHMITALPQGYDTLIDGEMPRLSGGQIKRIGLARACFGTPRILILDEPGAHLDAAGEAALISLIKTMAARGGVVVIVAHHPRLLRHCDLILRLDKGRATGFGPAPAMLSAPASAT